MREKKIKNEFRFFIRVKTFQTFSRVALEQKSFVEHIGVAFAQEFYWVTNVSTVMLCAPSWEGEKKLSFMIKIGLGAHDMSESEIGIGWKIVTKWIAADAHSISGRRIDIGAVVRG